MGIRLALCRLASVSVLITMASLAAPSGAAQASGDDRLLPPSVTPIGSFNGVPYFRYDGIFEGRTSTGAFRVPYRIAAAGDPELGNGTVLVEPPHFAVGLAALGLYLRPNLLFNRGFAHAGVGWSTTSFGPGANNRILDPTVPGVFIEGGFEDFNGRTDHEIIVDFARALAADPQANSLLGRVGHTYVTGVSDSSFPVMDLVTSGRAGNVFDLAMPFTTEWIDPQPALESALYRGKLLILNSEFETSGNLVDRGVAPGQYRFYAVAGTPHIPDLLEVPFFSSRSTPASWVPALRAHFLQGDRWVKSGAPPPGSYHLRMSGSGELDRDPNGNAIAVNAAGQPVPRLPYIELGEARYLTGFLGSYDTVKPISALGFATPAAYRRAFNAELARYADAGYILREEAAAMRARAALCPPLTYTETYRDHYENFVAIRLC